MALQHCECNQRRIINVKIAKMVDFMLHYTTIYYTTIKMFLKNLQNRLSYYYVLPISTVR